MNSIKINIEVEEDVKFYTLIISGNSEEISNELPFEIDENDSYDVLNYVVSDNKDVFIYFKNHFHKIQEFTFNLIINNKVEIMPMKELIKLIK